MLGHWFRSFGLVDEVVTDLCKVGFEFTKAFNKELLDLVKL